MTRVGKLDWSVKDAFGDEGAVIDYTGTHVRLRSIDGAAHLDERGVQSLIRDLESAGEHCFPNTLKQDPNDRGVRAFGEAASRPMPGIPTVPPREVLQLKLRLIAEEFFELLHAAGMPPARRTDSAQELINDAIARLDDADIREDFNMVEVVDALADLDYVSAGMALELGVNMRPVRAEVQRSNMSKCVEGKLVVREDGKVLKGETYSPPDIAAVLKAQGWEG